jgi:trans-aconitate 2-methyltransferase
MADDAWDPQQYSRFCDERQAPFFDLAALVEPAPGMRIVDLGCGTAELTAVFHQRLGARRTLGIDRSEKMLEAARARSVPGLELEQASIETLDLAEPFDLVFSNSVLHWLADHTGLLTRMTRWLAPGGQLAVQMPDNFSHASHRIARAVAAEEPFASALGTLPPWPVLAPERYAELLAELGYVKQHVRLQVYGHRLGRTDDVVEWVKGSLLTTFRARLDAELYARFVIAYRDRLLDELGERAPFFYTYRRLFVWGRLPGSG